MNAPTPQEKLRDFLEEGKKTFVASSNVAWAQYDKSQLVLRVGYLSGDTWDYFPISQQEAAHFLFAPSKGTWLWDFVRVRGAGNKHKHRRSAYRVR